jgi:hypothetical protein
MDRDVVDRDLLLAEARAALGQLPVEVTAASAVHEYQLRIEVSLGGTLVAYCAGPEVPGQGAELVVRTTVDRRAHSDLGVYVSEVADDHLHLGVRFVSRVAGRRRSNRVAVDELFLIYGAQEADGTVTDISEQGMRFVCPVAMVDGSEIRGMLNVEGRVFPVAAEVRHCSHGGEGYEIGVIFRHLHDHERELLAGLAANDELGRRQGETVDTDPTSPAPATPDDIRARLRRWAA